jgi:hypothetical protein
MPTDAADTSDPAGRGSLAGASLTPGQIARILLAQDLSPLRDAALAALARHDTAAAGWLARRAAALAPDQSWPCFLLAVHDRADAGHGTLALLRDVLASGDPAGVLALLRGACLSEDLCGGLYALGQEMVNRGNPAGAATFFATLAARAPRPLLYRPPDDWPRDIVAAVKNGASLASVMIPDPRLPTNAPRYLETYNHDHVILSDACFWALPGGAISRDIAAATFTAFAYCGTTRFFLRYTGQADQAPGSPVQVRFYPGDAYEHFTFVVRHDHVGVYDSAAPRDTAPLDAALRAGAPMRMVVEADDGLTHVLPVHLCFLYLDSGTVRVMSEYRTAPDICLQPVETLWPYYRCVLAAMDSGQEPDGTAPPADGERRLIAPALQARLAVRRLTLYSDGACETCAPDGTVERRRFQRFRLFAPRTATGG